MATDEHWIVASKMLEVLDEETVRAVLEAGGHIGGGWCEIHQHICVNAANREPIEEMLRKKGFTVSGAMEGRIRHPEIHGYREAGT